MCMSAVLLVIIPELVIDAGLGPLLFPEAPGAFNPAMPAGDFNPPGALFPVAFCEVFGEAWPWFALLAAVSKKRISVEIVKNEMDCRIIYEDGRFRCESRYQRQYLFEDKVFGKVKDTLGGSNEVLVGDRSHVHDSADIQGAKPVL